MDELGLTEDDMDDLATRRASEKRWSLEKRLMSADLTDEEKQAILEELGLENMSEEELEEYKKSIALEMLRSESLSQDERRSLAEALGMGDLSDEDLEEFVDKLKAEERGSTWGEEQRRRHLEDRLLSDDISEEEKLQIMKELGLSEEDVAKLATKREMDKRWSLEKRLLDPNLTEEEKQAILKELNMEHLTDEQLEEYKRAIALEMLRSETLTQEEKRSLAEAIGMDDVSDEALEVYIEKLKSEDRGDGWAERASLLSEYGVELESQKSEDRSAKPSAEEAASDYLDSFMAKRRSTALSAEEEEEIIEEMRKSGKSEAEIEAMRARINSYREEAAAAESPEAEERLIAEMRASGKTEEEIQVVRDRIESMRQRSSIYSEEDREAERKALAKMLDNEGLSEHDKDRIRKLIEESDDLSEDERYRAMRRLRLEMKRPSVFNIMSEKSSSLATDIKARWKAGEITDEEAEIIKIKLAQVMTSQEMLTLHEKIRTNEMTREDELNMVKLLPEGQRNSLLRLLNNENPRLAKLDTLSLKTGDSHAFYANPEGVLQQIIDSGTVDEARKALIADAWERIQNDPTLSAEQKREQLAQLLKENKDLVRTPTLELLKKDNLTDDEIKRLEKMYKEDKINLTEEQKAMLRSKISAEKKVPASVRAERRLEEAQRIKTERDRLGGHLVDKQRGSRQTSGGLMSILGYFGLVSGVLPKETPVTDPRRTRDVNRSNNPDESNADGLSTEDFRPGDRRRRRTHSRRPSDGDGYRRLRRRPEDGEGEDRGHGRLRVSYEDRRDPDRQVHRPYLRRDAHERDEEGNRRRRRHGDNDDRYDRSRDRASPSRPSGKGTVVRQYVDQYEEERRRQREPEQQRRYSPRNPPKRISAEKIDVYERLGGLRRRRESGDSEGGRSDVEEARSGSSLSSFTGRNVNNDNIRRRRDGGRREERKHHRHNHEDGKHRQNERYLHRDDHRNDRRYRHHHDDNKNRHTDDDRHHRRRMDIVERRRSSEWEKTAAVAAVVMENDAVRRHYRRPATLIGRPVKSAPHEELRYEKRKRRGEDDYF